MIDLSVKIGRTTYPNPVLVASGTFGYGPEFEELLDLSCLGGIVTKSVTLEVREGNPTPRIWETPSGMLNSIGLQNVGVTAFIRDKMPYLRKKGLKVVVSIAGKKIKDYLQLAEKLDPVEGIDAMEMNISCPNVEEGGLEFGRDCPNIEAIVRPTRKIWHKDLWVKLSPNPVAIAELAKAAQDSGADAVSLVNSFPAMAVDVRRKIPRLSTVTGGLTGPAIRPVAVACVWQVARAVTIPVVGIGGIMNTDDALEFFMAGAKAVQLGTVNFINPLAPLQIRDGLTRYCEQEGLTRLDPIIGCIKKREA